ncbi:MAG TPA: hypothetical protein PK252_02555 [Bacteroidales bacterium]|nr:hypothetical protein [Bacteroidales bacterium]
MIKKALYISFTFLLSGNVACNLYAQKTNELQEATVVYKKKPAAQSAAETSTSATSGNTAPAEPPKPVVKLDTIVRLGGKKIICNVKKVNPTTVEYVKPGNPTLVEIKRKDIEKIVYSNGRKEVYNKPIFSVLDKLQWQAVLVTENEAEVSGLYKVGVVKANASSSSRSPKAAKQSAIIRLQKKTANMGALIVLIINSEMKGGYGEIPGWEIEGIAYSDTPPVDTASVNQQIRKLIEKNKQRVNASK